MRFNPVVPIVIAAALNACALEPEALNSERIEERFGSYGIDVLGYEDGVRRSSLYSLEGDRKVCRTYAVVLFDNQLAPGVSAAHAGVLAGQSIGATFKASGWEIRKSTLYVGTLFLSPADHPVGQLMQLDEPAELAMHAYRLNVKRESQSVNYATIVELHHPDYLSPDQLKVLYDEDVKSRLSDTELGQLQSLALGTD